ncbi:S9 family peptidase [Corallincola platygyrae]
MLVDEFDWLIDRDFPVVDDPEVLSYVAAENSYYDAVMKPFKPLTDKLVEEANQRQVVKDSTGSLLEQVDYRRVGQFHYVAFAKPDSSLKLWKRAPVGKGNATAGLVHVLDEAELLADLSEPKLKATSIHKLFFSPDGRYVALGTYSHNIHESELKIYDLEAKLFLDSKFGPGLPVYVWMQDSQSLFYPTMNVDGLHQVRLHRLGTDPTKDKLLYQEKRGAFRNEMYLSTSGDYAFLYRGAQRSLQVLAFSTKSPELPPIETSPIKHNVMNFVDHANGKFYMRSNDTHRGYRIAVADDTGNGPGKWKTLLEGSDEVQLKRMMPFNGFVAVEANRAGQSDIVVLREDSKPQWLSFPDKAYTAILQRNQDPSQDKIRFSYFSLTTPYSHAVYDLATDKISGLSRLDMDMSLYATERLLVKVRDGVLVPVTLFYRKDLRKPGQPLHLTGFGAFGQTGEGWPRGFKFANERFSLLDRGVLYAMAHVRGGGELGPKWQQGGERMNRKNSFNDLVDVANYLIEKNYTQKGDISLYGDSAGGTLVGAAINQSPDLWAGALLIVPYVDPLSEMLDSENPAASSLWQMYGNPVRSEEAFDYVLSYNPYDQIAETAYPPQFIMTRWTDADVPYWQGARWVARMRERKTDDHLILLRTHQDGNHFGGATPSKDRYEQAEAMTFVLMVHGLADSTPAPLPTNKPTKLAMED